MVLEVASRYASTYLGDLQQGPLAPGNRSTDDSIMDAEERGGGGGGKKKNWLEITSELIVPYLGQDLCIANDNSAIFGSSQGHIQAACII